MSKRSHKNGRVILLGFVLACGMLAAFCIPSVRACLIDSGISLVSGELPGGG